MFGDFPSGRVNPWKYPISYYAFEIIHNNLKLSSADISHDIPFFVVTSSFVAGHSSVFDG